MHINLPYFQNQHRGTEYHDVHQMSVGSLHSSLSLETAKLVRWDVETVVNMGDREGQIQQIAGVTPLRSR